MPLKHSTETLLILALGAAILLTGIILGFLPPLSQSIVPWLVAFVLSVIYPVALYPLFKSRRADYPFRLLHFIPAIMLLLWVGFDLMATQVEGAGQIKSLYLWGWTVAAIIPAFFLVALFCIQVLRQRTNRLAMLSGLLVVFLAFALISESQRWQETAAPRLWAAMGVGPAIQVAQSSSIPNQQNLQPSKNPEEEQWRAQLRRMERRNQRLDQKSQGSTTIPTIVFASSSSTPLIAVQTSSISSDAWSSATQASSVVTVVQASSSSSSKQSLFGSLWGGEKESSSSSRAATASSAASSNPIVVKSPPRLSSSGPESMGGIVIVFLTAYSGLVHQRAVRRRKYGV